MTCRILATHRQTFRRIATALKRSAIFPIFAATLLGCSSTSNKACSLAACLSPGISLLISETSWSWNGQNPTISVCRSTTCITGNVDVLDAGSPLSEVTFAFPTVNLAPSSESDFAEVTITPTTTSSARVKISYFVVHSGQDLGDSDHYTVTLGSDNAPPLLYEQTVTYTVSYPNGPECGPTCRYADVTF